MKTAHPVSDVSVAEELERKTIETLERLNDKYENGLISSEAYQIGLKTVDWVTRGLIEDEVSHVIDNTVEESPKTSMRHLFYANASGSPKGHKLMMLSYQAGDEFYSLIDLVDGIRKKEIKNSEINQAAEAFHQFKVMRERMRKSGFKEVK